MRHGRRFEREIGQRPERTRHGEELRVGVDRHREVDRAVAHRGLGDARSDAASTQERGERVPETVDADLPRAYLSSAFGELGPLVRSA